MPVLKIAVPNGIETGLLDISKVALFSIVMGPVYITVIGRCVGAGDYGAADYYMRKLLRITYLGCIIWDTVMFALTPLALKLYRLSDEAVRLVLILCLIHNVFNALVHPAGFVLAGGLRAAGDVKYAMYTSIFASVICRVALSVLFGIWMGMGVIGVALAMVCDWGIRALLITKRYRNGKWRGFQVI